jgi:hypothetical protein
MIVSGFVRDVLLHLPICEPGCSSSPEAISMASPAACVPPVLAFDVAKVA